MHGKVSFVFIVSEPDLSPNPYCYSKTVHIFCHNREQYFNIDIFQFNSTSSKLNSIYHMNQLVNCNVSNHTNLEYHSPWTFFSKTVDHMSRAYQQTTSHQSCSLRFANKLRLLNLGGNYGKNSDKRHILLSGTLFAPRTTLHVSNMV